ncbi:MAG: hypothetical protein H0X51_05580 [Parachlamydiaceae bacterium]|nr:hypothetical protein [Parachlamydiaceae bacterium]
MKHTLTKLLKTVAVTVSLMTTTAVISAAEVVYDYSPDNRCCPTQCCNPVGDWYFKADALILKACEDGLAYGTAVTTTGPTSASPTATINSRVKNVHPKYDVGFRLGFGYMLPCDCWGLAVNWIHFSTHTNSHFDRNFAFDNETGTGNYFFPAYGASVYNFVELNGIDATEARWKLNLDVIDVELGRPFCVSECITIRPHIGIRAAWIRQTYNIENSVHVIATDAEVVVQDIHLRTNYQGVGLRGGLDTEWDLGCGMSLYGNAALGVLYGNFDVKSREHWIFFPGTTNSFEPEEKDEFCACRAITDAGLGLRWKQNFCCNTVGLILQVGWEHHYFFGQNQFEDFADIGGPVAFFPNLGEVKNGQARRGDLCVRGVTISARLDF